MLPSGYGGIFTMSRVGHRAGSIVSILDLFLFDSCLQISEWECVKHSLSLYLMSTFIWEANWSYVLKLRHRFLICINAYPSSPHFLFLHFESYVMNTYPVISRHELILQLRFPLFVISNVLFILLLSSPMREKRIK